MWSFQVQRDYVREEKDEYESEREDSATPSEDMTLSPCVQHNGSYTSHRGEEEEEDVDGNK